ncbi:hypothetical protein EDD29_1841 [Actinocorallia herbida]|uniref:Uncharacterized protein n=1 Tax=Actinocorallia herbida TaxID=58109 RepID=A0A3N1CSM8_9ACTN|nr:hypothetical protein [Actinocorallia herbida]ROO84321.1 hypothetical protein EDD29_1841 [Actinocorallia herbida]
MRFRAVIAATYTALVLGASVVTYLDGRDEAGYIPLLLLVDLPLLAFLPAPDPEWSRAGDLALPTAAGLLQAAVLWAAALVPVKRRTGGSG